MQSKRETMNQRCGILNQVERPKTSTEERMVGENRCSSIEVFSYYDIKNEMTMIVK